MTSERLVWILTVFFSLSAGVAIGSYKISKPASDEPPKWVMEHLGQEVHFLYRPSKPLTDEELGKVFRAIREAAEPEGDPK